MITRAPRRNGVQAPQGSSLAGKRLEPVADGALVRNTPERERRAANGITPAVVDYYDPNDGTKTTVELRRVASPLDVHRNHLPPELWAAGDDYATAAEAADLHRRITAPYDGMPRQHGKSKLGGVPTEQQQAYVRNRWFDSHLPARVRSFLRRYVVSSEISAQDMGQQIAPAWKDKSFLRGVTYGYLYCTLDFLAWLRVRDRGLTRRAPQSDLMRDTERLMPKMPEVKRLGEQMRRRG